MNIEHKADLSKVTPPLELNESERLIVFNYLLRRLAHHVNTAELYTLIEYTLSSEPEEAKEHIKDEQVAELRRWGQELLSYAWAALEEPGGGQCPVFDPTIDTSLAGLPPLPPAERINKLLHSILFMHLASSKEYHAHTRTFLSRLGSLDEDNIVQMLKNPESAIEEADHKTRSAREAQALRNQTLRKFGMGLAAIGGGILIGVSGGLAAPLVGAGVSAVLAWLGVGGTAAGILASGLAGSSVICGALFGAYGSKKSAEIVDRYTQDIQDLAIVPIRPPKESLGVRLCVSGWLASPEDVTEPWTVFGGDDTFALQWEIETLMRLSNALGMLLKSQALGYVKNKIIQRTVLAGFFAALSPTAWLNIGRIIDNPWMAAKARAIKTGEVLGALLEQHILGNRPITLVGYSLGSLVIFEALQYLARLPPSKTARLVQDVYLFGSPISTNEDSWASVRRVVSGRLVNGYSTNDYVLSVLSRISNAYWGVAGLGPVAVKGVENLECVGVDGHLQWRGMIGNHLRAFGAPGIIDSEVNLQLETRAKKIAEDIGMSQEEMQRAIEEGPKNQPT